MATRLYLRALTPTSGTADGNYYSWTYYWRTVGSLGTARYYVAGSGESATSALAAGGDTGGGTQTNVAESYNGTSWSTINTLNTARYGLGGCGTLSTTLVVGGYDGTSLSSVVESYNGSAWTNQTGINAARYGIGLVGSSSSARAYCGFTTSESKINEVYNGSTWSYNADANTARQGPGYCGSTNAALAIGGGISGATATKTTEKWNGSSWTNLEELQLALYYMGAFGATSTVAFRFCGGSPNTNTVERYNGSCWISNGNVNTAVYAPGSTGSTGSNNSGLCIGGNTSSAQAITQQYLTNPEQYSFASSTYPTGEQADETPNFSVTHTVRNLMPYKGTTQTSVSATSSGTASPQYGYFSQWVTPALAADVWVTSVADSTKTAHTSTGTYTAALTIGGTIALNTKTAATRHFNGTSWSAGGNIGTPKTYAAACGTSTATLHWCGQTTGYDNTTESYNGTTWSTGGSYLTGIMALGGCGTTSAALSAGGLSPLASALCKIYSGGSWTTTGSILTARYNPVLVGTTSSAYNYGTGFGETFNGSTWSSGTVNTLDTGWNKGNGSTSSAINVGGAANQGQISGASEKWNGSSWAATAPMLVNVHSHACAGTSGNESLLSSGSTVNAAYSGDSFRFSGNSLGSGTISVAVIDQQGSGQTNFWTNNVEVYVWRPSTNSKVGTLYSVAAASQGGSENSGGGTGAESTVFGPLSLSSVTIQSGDQVVVELWSYFTQAMSSSTSTCSIYFDGNTDVPFTENDTSVVGNAGSWVEFSENLAWHTATKRSYVLTNTVSKMQPLLAR